MEVAQRSLSRRDYDPEKLPEIYAEPINATPTCGALETAVFSPALDWCSSERAV